MQLKEHRLEALLREKPYSVYFYVSADANAVRRCAEKTAALLVANGAEQTRVEGPAPSIEEIIAAAGTISMFGTKRVVSTVLEPSAMREEDVAALCDVMRSLENAVLILTWTLSDARAKPSKKAKQLMDAAQETGLLAELSPPAPSDAKDYAIACAEALGAALSPSCATALIERCGMDFHVLENEIAKLAAMCGYGEVTRALITEAGTRNVEADVFDMTRMVTAGQTGAALAKLRQLLDMQNDPIPITAALAGSFVDIYRAKCGAAEQRTPAMIHKDFKYTGSDYRLKKAAESARAYTAAQLRAVLELLCALDTRLKSSSADKDAMLQAALCEIAAIRGGA